MKHLVARNVRDHRGKAETETQEAEAGKIAGAEAGRDNVPARRYLLPGTWWREFWVKRNSRQMHVWDVWLIDPMIQEHRQEEKQEQRSLLQVSPTLTFDHESLILFPTWFLNHFLPPPLLLPVNVPPWQASSPPLRVIHSPIHQKDIGGALPSQGGQHSSSHSGRPCQTRRPNAARFKKIHIHFYRHVNQSF